MGEPTNCETNEREVPNRTHQRHNFFMLRFFQPFFIVFSFLGCVCVCRNFNQFQGTTFHTKYASVEQPALDVFAKWMEQMDRYEMEHVSGCKRERAGKEGWEWESVSETGYKVNRRMKCIKVIQPNAWKRLHKYVPEPLYSMYMWRQ